MSVITVTWNSQQYIEAQLRSVVRAGRGIAYEHIVVDNHSTDQALPWIRKNFPTVQVIANTTNRGFAAANNQGLAQATGEYILFLNPDSVLSEQAIERLLAAFTLHPSALIVGPRFIDAEGKIVIEAQPRRFPTFSNQVAVLLGPRYAWTRRALADYRMHDADPLREALVDSVRGSCLMARRSFLDKLGFAFDPRYFIWFEDVDVCREAWEAGGEVWYVPTAVAEDAVGRSFARRSTWWKRQRFLRSALVYFWKWRSWSWPKKSAV